MSRPAVIGATCVVAAGAAVAATLVVVRGETPASPTMSEEQLAVRKTVFGTDKALPPIEKGQEMRPRW